MELLFGMRQVLLQVCKMLNVLLYVSSPAPYYTLSGISSRTGAIVTWREIRDTHGFRISNSNGVQQLE